MTLALLAVLDRVPESQRPIRFLPIDDVVLAIEALDEAPQVSVPALRRHDALLRELMSSCDALLPARFGSTFPDEDALFEAIRQRSGWLEALARVKGREQATLRLFLPESSASSPEPTWGPGRRHLEALRARRSTAKAALDWAMHKGLRELVRETLEENSAERLSTAFQLVDRGRADEWRVRVEALTPAAHERFGVRFKASAPWPPYAFAAEVSS